MLHTANRVDFMALVNLTEAATLSGISRAHLYKHYINTGNISVINSPSGRRMIDTSEILRVFGTLHGSTEHLTNDADTKDDRTEKDIAQMSLELAMLRELVKSKDEALLAKEGHINDLRAAMRLLEFKSENRKPWYKFW